VQKGLRLLVTPIHSSRFIVIIERTVNSACRYFFFFYAFFYLNIVFRAENDNNPANVFLYGDQTATGSLKYHLITTHLGEWISECDKLGITITGKQAGQAVAKYKGLSVEQQTKARMPFSKDNFLDAVVDFIVVTNQVFIFISVFYFSI
jgi:hypothetical protein